MFTAPCDRGVVLRADGAGGVVHGVLLVQVEQRDPGPREGALPGRRES